MSTQAEIAYEEMKQKLIEVAEKVKKDRADCAKERAEEQTLLKAQILLQLIHLRRVAVVPTWRVSEPTWSECGLEIPETMNADQLCRELVKENPCLKYGKGGYLGYEKRIIVFK